MDKKYSNEIGFRMLYDKFESSDLSVTDFCIKNDISKTYFYKLKNKYINNQTPKEVSFKPVKIIKNVPSNIVIINDFRINIDNINDQGLIRLLRIIKNL